ncbi:hypothetical protein PGT21_030726 [Puccinia graminis f. sp. tritici]|uniref:Uncharacterized protein n=1 Tax=Puccinia graminis f. sp. tritici TaxID=56615 RepID=A0A5B0NH42_PUCGR|nr:hypothetical protein PGT21_030726 [Puccinia graminis f. sp. tritici]
MLNHEPNQNDIIDQIVKGLSILLTKWNCRDLLAPKSSLPLNADDSTRDHDDVRLGRWKGLSPDKIKDQKALLLQLETRILPSLKHQLADLLKSLDLADPSKEPRPNLLDVLEIVSQIGQSFNQINGFLYSIAGNRNSSEHDHDYGGVKYFRYRPLMEKINRLMSHHIWILFQRHIPGILKRSKDHPIWLNDRSDLITHREQLIEGIARSSDYIDTIIKSSKRSDFNILQDEWRNYSNDLNNLLKSITVKINPADEEECLLIDVGRPESKYYKATVDQNHSINTDSAEMDFNSNNHEDTQSDANSLIDHEDNQSDTNCSTCSSEESFLRFMKLTQSIIPVIKLVRILLNKLSNPISRIPFTIDSKMSSMDIQSVQSNLSSLNYTIRSILNSLHYGYHSDQIMDQLENVKMLRERLSKDFDSSIALLCLYLVPSTDIELDLPASGDLIKTWSLGLSEQFSLATKIFDKALSEFEKESNS